MTMANSPRSFLPRDYEFPYKNVIPPGSGLAPSGIRPPLRRVWDALHAVVLARDDCYL